MINFCKPVIPDMDTVKNYLSESFHSGRLSNRGPCYQKLTNRLRSFLNINDDKDIILTSSGHTALMAAYYATETYTAAIPSYTFASTYTACEIFHGMDPLVFDVDPNTGALDLEQVSTMFCDTVVVTCPLSMVPNLEEISDWCARKNKTLIIDGASTFGTPDIYNYGDMFCLSFHATKSFPIGEGGAVICSKELTDKVNKFINFGLDSDKNIVTMGMNAKLSEYACAVGLALLSNPRSQFHNFHVALEQRRINADMYRQYLGEFVLPSWKDSTYQCFPIYLPANKVERVRKELSDSNIECHQYYKPVFSESNPVSTDLYNRNICLPVHQELYSEDVKRIARLVTKYI